MRIFRTSYSVLISGAGIGGPALAYWLARAGVEVTVVERAPAPRPGGQAVDIRGAARDVVQRMGLLSTIRSAGLEERGFAFVDEQGRHQASMPVSFMGGEGIVAEIEILRGELSRVLYEATCADAEYLFDNSIDSLVQDDNGVHVTFVNGGSRRFDLVIGADGVHSRVRSLAFGDGEAACVAPLGGYTAYFTIPHRIDTNDWFVIHNAPGGRAIGIRSGGPCATQVMLMFLSPSLGYERFEPARQKQILTRTFAGIGWEAPRVLDAMWDASDFYFDLVAQVRMERWTRGRVALLGDAACSPSPVTGLGTSLALVGAYVLAGELARSNGAHDAALPRYQSVMRDYVKQCQVLPPGGLEGILPRTSPAIWLRNMSMRIMTRWPVRGLVAGMFHRADAIVLDNYFASSLPEPAVAGSSWPDRFAARTRARRRRRVMVKGAQYGFVRLQRQASGVSDQAPGASPEDRGLVSRIGPLEIDWPKSLGYYGGIGLAVAFELLEPPLAIFIAAVPVLKLLKNPGEPWPLRIAADVLEGAAKPVGGDAESTVRVAQGEPSGRQRKAQ